jgi:hypothetical protein
MARRVAQIPRKRNQPNPVNQLVVCKQIATTFGIKHVDRVQAAGMVICRGKRRPVFLINNRFVMSAEHNISLELALTDLGGRPCRCMEARDELRAHRKHKLPPAFAKFVRDARHKHNRRETLKRLYADRYVVEMTKPGKFGNIQRMMRLLLRLKCNYITTRDPRCKIYVKRTIGLCHVYGGIVYAYSPETPSVDAIIQVNASWYDVLVKEKLAVVDGCLVLGVLDNDVDNRSGFTCSNDTKNLIGKLRRGELDYLYVITVAEYGESILKRRFALNKKLNQATVADVRMTTSTAVLRIIGGEPTLSTRQRPTT